MLSTTPGLDLIRKLRPVSFSWKNGGMRDLGLGAEDVRDIEPLLTTTNDKGEVEGVKYDRVGVVLVNAVQEQQLEIESQRAVIEEQKKRLEHQQTQLDEQARKLEALLKMICSEKKPEICK